MSSCPVGKPSPVAVADSSRPARATNSREVRAASLRTEAYCPMSRPGIRQSRGMRFNYSSARRRSLRGQFQQKISANLQAYLKTFNGAEGSISLAIVSLLRRTTSRRSVHTHTLVDVDTSSHWRIVWTLLCCTAVVLLLYTSSFMYHLFSYPEIIQSCGFLDALIHDKDCRKNKYRKIAVCSYAQASAYNANIVALTERRI